MKARTSAAALALLLFASGGDASAQRRAKRPAAAKAREAPQKPGGFTPLLDATCGGRWAEAEALLAAGADPNVSWVSIHAVPFTPLGCAVRVGDLRAVDALIAAGAEVNPKGNFPPLLFALEPGPGPGDPEVIAALVKRGADVNLRWHRGVTFLMLAAAGSPPEVVRALLGAGADVNARDDEGRGALGYAEQYNEGPGGGRAEVLGLLKRAGARE